MYDLGDKLLLVATDRISAFDWVLPTGIPDKGRVLTQFSSFWFDELGEPNHVLSTDVDRMDELPAGTDREPLAGRATLVRKTQVVPIECVVRGYLPGSGWKEYKKQGTVCGIKLPPGLTESDKLPEPIFTPATKEESGHDINISFEQMVEIVGKDVAEELRKRSISVYQRGAELRPAARESSSPTRSSSGGAFRRPVDPDRRSADARQLALLARRRLSPRRQPSVVRQAVRPRLARNDRLGQEQHAARAARRCRRADAREIHRGVRTIDRAQLSLAIAGKFLSRSGRCNRLPARCGF